MSGIVERLRNATTRLAGEDNRQATIRRNQTIGEAADTIEALCEALDIALEALRAEGCCDKHCPSCAEARALIAKAGV